MTQRVFSKEAEEALNNFATKFLNTGCDWQEARDHAEFIYYQAMRSCNHECWAIHKLQTEAVRYEDM